MIMTSYAQRGNGTGDYSLVCALLRAQLASQSGLSIQHAVMCQLEPILLTVHSSSPVMGHVT